MTSFFPSSPLSLPQLLLQGRRLTFFPRGFLLINRGSNLLGCRLLGNLLG
ncbi:Hypothetical protein FKW44_007164 [Caligus rogercresseyi]|uniref:Uncharacterized protein n=1 Tax=Caligus rogercresseyi TaxID=217165 RepID=A0A7T8KEC5_CALRO|nr:Hypothetical protein FKW44_007164 [Caligus rogercresseyi]